MEYSETFVTRAYGRTELAQRYNPDLHPQVAYRKLQQWIRCYPGLLDVLQQHGYTEHARSYTPIQVRLIVDALGEP